MMHLRKPTRYCNATLLFLASFLLSYESLAFGVGEITVETTSCTGETGFSSFYSGDLFKIRDGDCVDPEEPDQNLQQVFVHSKINPGSYDMLWVTKDEARNIMAQIRGLSSPVPQAPRTKPTRVREAAAPQETVFEELEFEEAERVEAGVEEAELSGPSIQMIDPVLISTRSSTAISSAADIEERTIVGKVDAPAGLVSVTVNGSAAKIDDNGIFTGKVGLQPGRNAVTVIAVDKQGRSQNIKFKLKREQAKKPKVENSDEFGRYYALIIANTDYQHLDDLMTPTNDAKALGELLENRYGFEVNIVKNATRYDLMTALNKARSDLSEKDNLLIYYAGHGAFDKTNKRGHWLPVDAEPESTANWVSTTSITDIVNSMSAKHILLVADSCYSGSLTRNSTINLDAGMSDDARDKWLRTMAKSRSRHLLTSGGIKPVLDDGGDGHSIFASALIEILEDSEGIVEGSAIYRQIKTKVETRAKELEVEQSPLYAKLQEGEHEYAEFLLISR